MKVRRKYIPLAVRVVVAERQLQERGYFHTAESQLSLSLRLKSRLGLLFGDAKVELHHRPALENRRWMPRRNDYEPQANDPAHLVYLLKDEEHKIETYVRGINGQLSDAGLRRKNKKMAKNRESKLVTGVQLRGRLAKLTASRPIAARKNPWPKDRKMGSRQ